MPDTYDEALQWAMDRIGKRIFAQSLPCECKTCAKVYREGLVIADSAQARYVAACGKWMSFKFADSKDEL